MAANGTFLIYLGTLVLMVLGGFYGLVESDGNPGFLVPILFGLFFFYVLWEAVVGPPEAREAQRSKGHRHDR